MSGLFVSYSRLDRPAVRRIVRELTALDLVVWYDENALLGGAEFAQEIYSGVEDCAAFLFMQSPNALASEWTVRECRRAVTAGKPIIPVLVEKIDPARNRFPDLHWIDLSDHSDRERFMTGIYDLVRSLHERTQTPGAAAALEKIKEKVGFARIGAHLEELSENARAARRWLEQVEAIGEGAARAGAEFEPEKVSETLAAMALEERGADKQIAAQAARTIARTADEAAVRGIAAQLEDEHVRERALEALRLIWEAGPRRPIWSMLGSWAGAVRRRIALAQLGARPAFWPIAAPILAAIVAIGFLVFNSFGNFGDGGFLSNIRLDSTTAKGLAYGLTLGSALAFAAVLAPRLRIYGPARFALALVGGWLLTFVFFFLLNALHYNASRAGEVGQLLGIAGLSAVFVSGFFLGGLVPAGGIDRWLLRAVLAAAGVFAALYLPTALGWSVIQLRLISLSPSAAFSTALIAAALLGGIAYLPEFLRAIRERGGLLHRLSMR